MDVIGWIMIGVACWLALAAVVAVVVIVVIRHGDEEVPETREESTDAGTAERADGR